MTSRELLRTGAETIGIYLSIEYIDSFFVYFAELEKWNKKINLTNIREKQDIVIKHGLDSLSYIKGFAPSRGLRLLDLGSGAGFPALPIKIIHPEIAVTLVESVKKKASFLRHIVRTLKLKSVEVIDTRTDQLSDSFHTAFDVVTARAFAGMASVLSAGSPFLKQDGLLVLSRGPEETICENELARFGFALENQIELTLPHSNYKRTIWVFRKLGNVPHGTMKLPAAS